MCPQPGATAWPVIAAAALRFVAFTQHAMHDTSKKSAAAHNMGTRERTVYAATIAINATVILFPGFARGGRAAGWVSFTCRFRICLRSASHLRQTKRRSPFRLRFSFNSCSRVRRKTKEDKIRPRRSLTLKKIKEVRSGFFLFYFS